MDGKEKGMKIKMLQDTLKNDFGITSDAELIKAIKHTPPIDISIFVLPRPDTFGGTEAT